MPFLADSGQETPPPGGVSLFGPPQLVTPAKAGAQRLQQKPDPGLRRDDDLWVFRESIATDVAPTKGYRASSLARTTSSRISPAPPGDTRASRLASGLPPIQREGSAACT